MKNHSFVCCFILLFSIFLFGSNSFGQGEVEEISFSVGENPYLLTATDGTSVLEIETFEDWRLKAVELPNGKQLRVDWIITSEGKWVAERIKCFEVDGSSNLMAGPNACRDALVAIGIAAGVCTASPGSAGCYAAVANAGYHTYRCYEQMNPMAIWSNSSLRKSQISAKVQVLFFHMPIRKFPNMPREPQTIQEKYGA